jgi:hypothetical protein
MRAIAAALSASLAGCAVPSAMGSAGSVAATPFHCPKPGTAVRFNNAEDPVVFSGFDPADPLICLGRFPNGKAFRRVAAFVVPPSGQERAIRDGLAPLFPIPPSSMASDTAQFGYYQGYRNEPATGQFIERWTRIGSETLQIAGKPVETVLFQQEIDNTQSYGSLGIRWRLWFAPESGVWVRGEPKLLRGDARPRPFLATSLMVP